MTETIIIRKWKWDVLLPTLISILLISLTPLGILHQEWFETSSYGRCLDYDSDSIWRFPSNCMGEGKMKAWAIGTLFILGLILLIFSSRRRPYERIELCKQTRKVS